MSDYTPPTKAAVARHNKDVSSLLTGRVIKKLVSLGSLPELIKENYWEDADPSTPVIILDDGTYLFPARDLEGNGPGALFGEGVITAGSERMPFHLFFMRE